MEYEEFVSNLVGRDKEYWSNGKYLGKWSFAITSYSLPRVNAQLGIAKRGTKRRLLKEKEKLIEKNGFIKRRLGEIQGVMKCKH